MKPAAKFGIAAAVLVVLLGAAGAFWFLRDDAPDEVSLDAAVDAAGATTTTTSPDGSVPPTTAADGDVSGTWNVRIESGEFGSGTFAGFRIVEELVSIGQTEAVGRTGEVTGEVVIDGTTVTSADIEVDMASITTNDPRRDNKVQEALETGQFPTATFSLTEPIDLGDDPASGQEISATATGDLTIHGVTRSVQIPLQAQLVDGAIVLVGSTEVTFSDFDVAVPSAPIVVSVEDTGTLELQLLLTRG